MENPKNAERVLDLLWKNYSEQNEINKRIADRVTIVLGVTATAFGFVAKLPSVDNHGVFYAVMLILSLLCLLAAFVIGSLVWSPRDGLQPSFMSLEEIWHHQIVVSEDTAVANLINDLCLVIEESRERTGIIAKWFTRCLMLCGASLVLVVMSSVPVLAG